MKHLSILLLSVILCFACKHDHAHGEKGHDHPHVQNAEQDHDGHNHNSHDHNSHDHSSHDHSSHDHSSHDHSSHDHSSHDHSDHDAHNHSEQGVQANIISPAEKAQGWVSLFDGKSISQWRGYKDDISSKWVIDNGMLHFNPEIKGKGGDIISIKQYENFELSLDWKIQDCGNSGIFWNVVESDKFERTYHSGPEMQILDNKCHPDAKIKTHRAGDLYDMIETSTVNVKPAMQWNESRILSKDGHYTFYQNGQKVVEFKMHTPEWDAMIAKSKFKDLDGFGKAKRGHIALQDHSDKVWFRNIRIREI